MKRAFVIGIVGAESTGKSQLALALCEALATRSRSTALVGEYLREFCDLRGRTPARDEQAAIAEEQTRRIDAAARSHDIVVADTTALMTAVYSRWVFGDGSLMAAALRAHQRCNLSLLTALDIAWQPDGLQRDGAHVREPIDALVRSALQVQGTAYSVVAGLGPQRLAAALAAVERALGSPSKPPAASWQWVCERCGDAGCERHLLPRG